MLFSQVYVCVSMYVHSNQIPSSFDLRSMRVLENDISFQENLIKRNLVYFSKSFHNTRMRFKQKSLKKSNIKFPSLNLRIIVLINAEHPKLLTQQCFLLYLPIIKI